MRDWNRRVAEAVNSLLGDEGGVRDRSAKVEDADDAEGTGRHGGPNVIPQERN